jgi:hypothetical protein
MAPAFPVLREAEVGLEYQQERQQHADDGVEGRIAIAPVQYFHLRWGCVAPSAQPLRGMCQIACRSGLCIGCEAMARPACLRVRTLSTVVGDVSLTWMRIDRKAHMHIWGMHALKTDPFHRKTTFQKSEKKENNPGRAS